MKQIEDILKENSLINKIEEFLEEMVKFNNRANGSFLTGSSLTLLIHNYIHKTSYSYQNDVDIFIPVESNERFYYKGILEKLNPTKKEVKVRGYGYTDTDTKIIENYQKFLKKRSYREKVINQDRYNYIKEKVGEKYIHTYALAGNFKEEQNGFLIDYTFINQDENFSYHKFLETFDLNCTQVLYDLNKKELVYTKSFLNYLKNQQIKPTNFSWKEGFSGDNLFFKTILRGIKKSKEYNSKFDSQLYLSYFQLMVVTNNKKISDINRHILSGFFDTYNKMPFQLREENNETMIGYIPSNNFKFKFPKKYLDIFNKTEYFNIFSHDVFFNIPEDTLNKFSKIKNKYYYDNLNEFIFRSQIVLKDYAF